MDEALQKKLDAARAAVDALVQHESPDYDLWNQTAVTLLRVHVEDANAAARTKAKQAEAKARDEAQAAEEKAAAEAKKE